MTGHLSAAPLNCTQEPRQSQNCRQIIQSTSKFPPAYSKKWGLDKLKGYATLKSVLSAVFHSFFQNYYKTTGFFSCLSLIKLLPVAPGNVYFFFLNYRVEWFSFNYRRVHSIQFFYCIKYRILSHIK